MLVSIIIPVYNRLNSLKRAIESVFCQTFKAYEIIVVDDGSDKYDLELALYAYLKRINLITNKINKGPSYARNLGIEASKGQYIAFLDSDDIWLPFKLQLQLDMLEKDTNKYICHTDEFWFKNGKFINKIPLHISYSGKIFEDILDKCRISPSSILLKKSVFDKVGLFDTNLRVCEDYEFFLRAALHFNFEYINVPTIVKISEEENQLSKHIKHIEYIRMNILIDLLQNIKCLPTTYQQAVIKEINRKRSIIKKGLLKNS